MPLLINCSYPFAAPRHSHLWAPPHVCCHVCRARARPCLSMGWALNQSSILDHKNSGPKISSKRRFNAHPVLRQGRACTKGGGRCRTYWNI